MFYEYNGKLGLRNVKNIVLVSSAKGGVGKSTTASNIAAGLHYLGHKVGMLDADIYGPSQYMMFGIEYDGGQFELDPITQFAYPKISKHGIKVSSMAGRVDGNTVLEWRGPMLSMVLKQLAFETEWGELDYLVVDMPPGTGDVQISMSDNFKDAKVVIVTTPQEVALIDCRKGIELYRNNKIDIIGVVENMSSFACPCCNHVEHIFGSDGGENLAKEYNTEILGNIPIVTDIRKDADSGTPIVIEKPDHPISKSYIEVCTKIAEVFRIYNEKKEAEEAERKRKENAQQNNG
jgi:ATP-binding protein involved in chromosome partitioning